MDILYIRSASKKQLNRELAQGSEVIGTHYPHNGPTRSVSLTSAPDGTVVKLFTIRDSTGNPISKGVGVWNLKKRCVE